MIFDDLDKLFKKYSDAYGCVLNVNDYMDVLAEGKKERFEPSTYRSLLKVGFFGTFTTSDFEKKTIYIRKVVKTGEMLPVKENFITSEKEFSVDDWKEHHPGWKVKKRKNKDK